MVDQFEGFEDPKENWSKLPHVLIEALPMIETVSEFKVIVYILRHTWGYHDDEKRITLDEFANGRKRKNGSRIDCGTGLTIPSIRDGLKRAIRHGFIEHRQDASDKARVKNFYTLKMRGKKVLHPECKEDSASVKESIPRTEKETLETNLVQENDNAPSPQPATHDPTFLPETDVQLDYLFPQQTRGIEQQLTDLKAAGWDLGSDDLNCALAWCLKATNLTIPPDKGDRKDWAEDIAAHVQEFGLKGLGDLYQRAVTRMDENGWNIGRPGALTKTLRGVKRQQRKDDLAFLDLGEEPTAPAPPDPLAAWWRDQQPLLVQFKAALVGAEPVSKDNGTLVLMVPDSGREQLAQGGRLEKMESALGLAVEVVAGGPGEKGG